VERAIERSLPACGLGTPPIPHDRPQRRPPLPLPDFHAIRHAAAIDCEDAEEAADLLRHRNSTVTRAVYRAHFRDRRREALRARMEARLEAANGNGPQQASDARGGEVVDSQDVRHLLRRRFRRSRARPAGSS
jgi:hypothetical protein